MGHRANLIVRREGRVELFYTHWRGSTLDKDLFWGPGPAEGLIRSQRSQAEGATWLDEVWAEGGAVLDVDARVLLWFGGGDLLYDVPLRRVHLGLMRELWAGWEVRWAHGDIVELATYLGRGTADLLAPEEAPGVPPIEEPDDPEFLLSVVSRRDRDGSFQVLGSAAEPEDLAGAGTPLIEGLRAATLPEALEWPGVEFPAGGLHLDEARHRLDVWTAAPQPAFEARVGARWPGWTVVWHRDRFEAVGALLGDRLRLPRPDVPALVKRIEQRVLHAPRDKSGLLDEMRARTESGAVVHTNPFALRDDPPPAPGVAEAKALADAVARWRRGESQL